MFIGNLALRIAESVSRHNNRPDVSVAKIKLSVHIMLNYLFVFITVLACSFLLNNTYQAVLGYFTFVILRLFSGSSWHFKNDLHCYLFSSMMLIFVPLIGLPINPVYIHSFSCLLMLLFAPSSRRLNMFSVKGFAFKATSFLIAAAVLIWDKQGLLANVVLLQALSVIPVKRGN